MGLSSNFRNEKRHLEAERFEKCSLILFSYLWIYFRERAQLGEEAEGESEGEKESQADSGLNVEPHSGFHPTTLIS